jgi:hypothetical protein
MKLVKSLLLSSAAGITAVAGAQAADLPFRKAAPVEYVRVCDYTGAGYWYIPGTDTCLKIEGYSRTDFAYVDPKSVFYPAASGVLGVAGGAIQAASNRHSDGFREEGRVAVDTRTQTAYGTLRTYVRFQADAAGGYFTGNPAGSAISPTSPAFFNTPSNTAYIDKAFVQFAGFTAGRVQSFFDFYADNYNFEDIANSDTSTEVFAYTATFGNGFSATISVEDATNRRSRILDAADPVLGFTNANYAGEEIPDVVGVVRIDQAWGAAQLSAAYHQVRVNETDTTAFTGDTVFGSTKDGFAVQGGVQFKLPMLAAGDDFWLEGGYSQGAISYVNTDQVLNNGANSIVLGGFYRNDGDAIAFRNADGSFSVSLNEAYHVDGAFHHYFTPNFSDVLFGSYVHYSYGNRAQNTDWTLGGLGDGSEYRIGNQFIWTPVNNLSVGIEVLYAHLDQTIAHNPGLAATALPAGIHPNEDTFEGRLRVERDF